MGLKPAAAAAMMRKMKESKNSRLSDIFQLIGSGTYKNTKPRTE
jgi:hypothetical protein